MYMPRLIRINPDLDWWDEGFGSPVAVMIRWF